MPQKQQAMMRRRSSAEVAAELAAALRGAGVPAEMKDEYGHISPNRARQKEALAQNARLTFPWHEDRTPESVGGRMDDEARQHYETLYQGRRTEDELERRRQRRAMSERNLRLLLTGKEK